MAIALISSAVYDAQSASSVVSLPLTVPDPNAVIFVALGLDAVTNANPTVIWDSTTANSSLTQIAEVTSSGRWIGVFYITNPTTGTHEVLASGFSTVLQHAGIGAAYSGVDQTTPYDTNSVSAIGQAASISTGFESTAIPSAVGDLILSWMVVNNNASTHVDFSAGATLRALSTVGSNLGMVGVEMPGAATVTSTYSWRGSTVGADASMIAININADAGAASTVSRRSARMMMGIGR